MNKFKLSSYAFIFNLKNHKKIKKRLLDLITLGFSDVLIAETLHVSLESVTEAKARLNL